MIINRIYNQYKADQQDGFVSNLDTWLEAFVSNNDTLIIEHLKEEIELRVQADIYLGEPKDEPDVCKSCFWNNSKTCLGCPIPYDA